ncbi:response regulator transcription factor [Alteromonadaceae bacterium BrNp21-10]|nr:response regulator transcription factor [Alteromonadaceae bacterium BrNp21-10]
MKLLLVEDDIALADALAMSLRSESYAVDCVTTGAQALSALSCNDIDMLILDLGLPDMDGLEVLVKVRHQKNAIPVLILTARDGMSDKITGLDLGADDYLPKPFDMPELFARLRVMERRLGTANSALITAGNVSMDTAAHDVRVDNIQIDLSRREFMLLKALMENLGRIQSKHQLESKLYEWGDEVASNTVEVHVHNLRKKLPTDFIKTIRGVGYSINSHSTAQTA